MIVFFEQHHALGNKKIENPVSQVEEFNAGILQGADMLKSPNDKSLRPQTAKERILQNFIVKGPKSGIESSKEKSKRIIKNQQTVAKVKEQKKTLPPPPLGQTMGHGLIQPRKNSPNMKNDPVI